jgi:hypothetical protein
MRVLIQIVLVALFAIASHCCSNNSYSHALQYLFTRKYSADFRFFPCAFLIFFSDIQVPGLPGTQISQVTFFLRYCRTTDEAIFLLFEHTVIDDNYSSWRERG